MNPIDCFIQVCVTIMGFKVGKGAKTTKYQAQLFFFDEKPEEGANDVKSQYKLLKFCLRFQFPATLANHSRNG